MTFQISLISILSYSLFSCLFRNFKSFIGHNSKEEHSLSLSLSPLTLTQTLISYYSSSQIYLTTQLICVMLLLVVVVVYVCVFFIFYFQDRARPQTDPTPITNMNIWPRPDPSIYSTYPRPSTQVGGLVGWVHAQPYMEILRDKMSLPCIDRFSNVELAFFFLIFLFIENDKATIFFFFLYINC